jgi:MazG family protein
MQSSEKREAGEAFNRLVEIMARLRGPGGCPWDREQTFDSIKPYTLEETYEVLDAIDARDWPGLADELGDFLLQAVFYAQMAEEAGSFRIEDALNAINRKLVRRHPHIFSDTTASTAEEVKQNWDRIKAAEKAGRKDQSILDNISRAAPALMEAAQISSKAAGAGFDWPDADAVLAKLDEEVLELADARRNASAETIAGQIEDEIGDILFTVVNLARWVKADPEQALRKTNAKFRRRFGYIESRLSAAGRTLADAGLEEMETLWAEAKAQEAQLADR